MSRPGRASERARLLWVGVLLAGLICAGCGVSGASAGATARRGTVLRRGPRVRGGPHVDGAGGKFAGYIYQGSVRSIGASWRVPAVAADSRLGKASTWIGAQAPGGTRAPFIQIGTQEEMRAAPAAGRAPVRFYEAFFSDAKRAFHPDALFTVRPGDEVTADMQLVHHRWTLSIEDGSTGAGDRFSTAEEGRADFNYGLWLQEDVTDTHGDTPFPYPDMAGPQISSLAVNGDNPVAAQLHSTWMSLPGGYLGPTPFQAGAFTVIPRRLSAAGARYLTIAGPEDADATSFSGEIEHWRPSTAAALIRRETDAFVSALNTSAARLRAVTWPPSIARLITRLVAFDAADVRDLRAAAGTGETGVLRAFLAVESRASRVTAAVRLLRGRLGVPALDY